VTDSPERQVDQATERDGTAAVSPVRVAAVHFDMQVGTENRQRNIKHGLDLARRAVDDGCTLIVLPELASTGYTFTSRQEAFAHAEPVPDGDTIRCSHDAYESRSMPKHQLTATAVSPG
jgi:N-carbamoylputrescine amidase